MFILVLHINLFSEGFGSVGDCCSQRKYKKDTLSLELKSEFIPFFQYGGVFAK